METRAPWFILGVLLGATLFIPLLFAQSDPELWTNEERHLTFTQTADGFRYESARDTELGNDLIEGTFSSANRRLTTTYLDRSQPNMTPLRLAVDFEALIEYQDNDGDGAYGLGDRIIQRLRIVDFLAPTQKVEALPTGGHRAEYAYSVSDGIRSEDPGVLRLTFIVSPSAQPGEDGSVPPMSMRLHMQVERFPYEDNSTLLAAETRIYGNGPVQSDDNTFSLEGNDRRLFYEWPGEGVVDGDVRPVHVTLLDGTAQSTVAGTRPVVVLHSYERGEDVSYETAVGVDREEPEGQNVLVELLAHGDWRLYGFGVLIAIGLVGATVWRRIERA